MCCYLFVVFLFLLSFWYMLGSYKARGDARQLQPAIARDGGWTGRFCIYMYMPRAGGEGGDGDLDGRAQQLKPCF